MQLVKFLHMFSKMVIDWESVKHIQQICPTRTERFFVTMGIYLPLSLRYLTGVPKIQICGRIRYSCRMQADQNKSLVRTYLFLAI